MHISQSREPLSCTPICPYLDYLKAIFCKLSIINVVGRSQY
uniref:Uncharacterized protein n=1 Tax=Arundo donax TaxID=35708 RepID=A0A0A8Y3X7_ARUDO